MNILITYSDSKYANARKFCAKMAKKYGKFDRVIEYSPKDLDEDFVKKNKRILDTKRGGGLWLWKPYVINKALSEICTDGDILYYADAGTFFFRSCLPLFKQMKDDILCFELPYVEEEFTKAETFELMALIGDKYSKTSQIWSNMAFRCSPKTKAFVKEWLDFCCDFNVISPDFDPTKQVRTFFSHREDQSVFSLLCKKYGVQPVPEPTLWGWAGNPHFHELSYRNIKRPSYICIVLHRCREVTFCNVLKNVWYMIKLFVENRIGYTKHVDLVNWKTTENDKYKD